MHRLSGPGAIHHGDAVTFKSSSGTWLTAMPPSTFASQLQNSGTSEGAWQQLNLDFVHSFDMDRQRY